jgi:hypothetical protein
MPLLVIIASFVSTKLIQLQYDGIHHSLTCDSNFQFLPTIHALYSSTANHRVVPCLLHGLQQQLSRKCLRGLAEIIYALPRHKGPFVLRLYFESARDSILLFSAAGMAVPLNNSHIVPKFVYWPTRSLMAQSLPWKLNLLKILPLSWTPKLNFSCQKRLIWIQCWPS